MTRVVFTFDPGSLHRLTRMTQEGSYASMADAVRESLQIQRTFMTQAAQGFTQVILHNPSTGDERELVIPRLRLIRAVQG